METWRPLSHEPKTNVSSLQFEWIFAVNLPPRTDHRDALTLMSTLRGLQLDFADGLDGNKLPDKALAYPALHEFMRAANIGSWRGHLNALRAYAFLSW